MKRIRARKRYGSNLIELVLVMPAMCIVLVQTTMVLRQVFRINSIAKHRSEAALHLTKLERMLRQDAHRALRAQVIAKTEKRAQVMRLDGSGEDTVEYEFQKQGIVRIAWSSDANRSVERFELYDAMRADITLDVDRDLPSRVMIDLFRELPDDSRKGRLEMHVEVFVGRHSPRP
jgi:type II secretory pathway component PulJ